jgi:hypothetical protein
MSAPIPSDVAPQSDIRAPQELASRRIFAPRSGRGVRAFRWPLIACAVAFLVCGWWLIRNMLVYGPLDPVAMVRHDEIVVGQPRWATYDLEAFDYFFRILFRSFWGMFGWMGVVLDDGYYILYLVLTVLGVAGLIIRRERVPTPAANMSRAESGAQTSDMAASAGAMNRAPTTADPLGAQFIAPLGGRGILHHRPLLLWATVLVFAEVAYYNLTFIQPQGRYLFPALVPIALFLARGWQRLADRAAGGWRSRLLVAGPLAGAIAWGLGEVHGSLRAAELWSDNALIAAATAGVLVVFLTPRAVRAWLPDGLCLLLAITLGLLDYAALVKFVAPAFPLR